MAYNTHFSFLFESPCGTEFTIKLKQDGYEGIPIKRALGQSPVLKREQNGRIWGTSLEIYAECAEDEEFADLYTSSPFEWMVELEQSDGIGGSVIWRGYVVPELYSEPDIAPPYDVQIIATDNLGELKFKPIDEDSFEDADTLQDVLMELLGATRLGVTDGRMLSTLEIDPTESTSESMPPLSIKWPRIRERYLNEGNKTYYDVLQDLLAIVGAYAYFGNDLRWWLVRETDCEIGGIWGNALVNKKDLATGAAVATLSDDIATLGENSEWWPVGSLTSIVEPARKSVLVSENPSYFDSLIDDPDMDASYPNDFWHYVGKGYHVSYEGESGYVLGQRVTSTAGSEVLEGRLINYPVTVPYIAGKRYTLEVTAKTWLRDVNPPYAAQREKARDRWLYMMVQLVTPGGSAFYLAHESQDDRPRYIWQSQATTLMYQLPEGEYDNAGYAKSADTQLMTITLPIVQDTPAGTIVVEFRNKTGQSTDPFSDLIGGRIMVCSCNLQVSEDYRLKNSACRVLINNQARTAADEEILAAQTGLNIDTAFRRDIIVASDGGEIASIGCQQFNASRLLEFVAMDRAFTVALPRMRMKGTLNVPKGKWMPVIFRRRSVDYILQTYTWKLAEDEVEIDALSVPAASITIDDLTVITKEA